MEENKKYFLLGMFFLFVQLVVIIRNVTDNYINFFWFCDFVSLPLAIGFFFKEETFIKSLINIGLIGQLATIVFYIYKLLSGVSLTGIIPDSVTLSYALSSIFIHLSTIIALIFTYKIKPTMKTLFYSLIFLYVMYIGALFFTTPEQGINYTLSFGNVIPLVIPNYAALWISFMFILIVLPTQLIQYLFYRHYIKKMKKITPHFK